MHTFFWTLITDLQVQLFRLFSFGLVPPQKHHPYCRKPLVPNVNRPNVIWLIGRPGMASVNIEQPNAAVSNTWYQTLYD